MHRPKERRQGQDLTPSTGDANRATKVTRPGDVLALPTALFHKLSGQTSSIQSCPSKRTTRPVPVVAQRNDSLLASL